MVYIFPIERTVQRTVISVGVIFATLPAVAVALRILARRLSHRKLDMSDYLIIAACAVVVAYQAVVIAAVLAGGMGYHTTEIIAMERAESIILLNKFVLAVQVLWSISLGLTKGSILILYTKVFQVNSFVLMSKITAILVLLWALVLIVGPFVICRPLEYNWNSTVAGGHCGNMKVMWYVTGVFNIITDLLILLLPMPYLYSLELALYKKLALMATFGIGLLVCVVSAVRLVMLVRINMMDLPFTLPVAVMFSALEPCLLITAACVPLLRPLLGYRYSPNGTARSRGTGFSKTQKDGEGFEKLDEDLSAKALRLDPVHYDAVVAAKHGDTSPDTDGPTIHRHMELESISVKKDWKVEGEITRQMG